MLSGFASRFLTKIRVRVIYFSWLFLTFFAWVPCSYIDELLRLCSMFICVLFCRYFFVYLRYKSIGRGNGAPGFMVYWLSLYGFLFYICNYLGLDDAFLSLIFLVDFSLIMISAGVYKVLNGYSNGSGIEYGLCNPTWCYFSNYFQSLFVLARSMKKDKLLRGLLNYPSFITEFLIGFSIFFVPLRAFGSLLLFVTFVMLSIIKLGTLPITMISVSVSIYLQDFDVLQDLTHFSPLEWIALSYIPCLFLSYVWVWSFNLGINLPRTLNKLSNFSYQLTGVIIWSVFTREITKHLFVVLGQQRGNSLGSVTVRSVDEGVHSGISRATILTRFNRGLDDIENLKFRILTYINSDVFKDVRVMEIQCYEVCPGEVTDCFVFKSGWRVLDRHQLIPIIKPSQQFQNL